MGGVGERKRAPESSGGPQQSGKRGVLSKNQRKQHDRDPDGRLDGTEKGSGQRKAGTPLTVSGDSPSAMVF